VLRFEAAGHILPQPEALDVAWIVEKSEENEVIDGRSAFNCREVKGMMWNNPFR